MNADLKKGFKEIEYYCRHTKAALTYRQYTHDSTATELDNSHSSYGISHKITSTVMGNGSNFIVAFKKYQ